MIEQTRKPTHIIMRWPCGLGKRWSFHKGCWDSCTSMWKTYNWTPTLQCTCTHMCAHTHIHIQLRHGKHLCMKDKVLKKITLYGSRLKEFPKQDTISTNHTGKDQQIRPCQNVKFQITEWHHQEQRKLTSVRKGLHFHIHFRISFRKAAGIDRRWLLLIFIWGEMPSNNAELPIHECGMSIYLFSSPDHEHGIAIFVYSAHQSMNMECLFVYSANFQFLSVEYYSLQSSSLAHVLLNF